MRRIIRCSVIGLLALLVVGVIASWLVAGWLVAPEPRLIGDPPTDLPVTSISLVSDSGSTIAGWHIPSGNLKGVVVLLHSIRGSRLSMLERARVRLDSILSSHTPAPLDENLEAELERIVLSARKNLTAVT